MANATLESPENEHENETDAPPSEIAKSKECFKENREKNAASTKAMRDEVERIMKLVRDKRSRNAQMIIKSQEYAKMESEVRRTIEQLQETVLSVVKTSPDSGRAKKTSQEEDDLDGIAGLADKLKKAKEDLAKTKEQLNGMKDEADQIRKETEEMRRALDDAANKLSESVGDKDGKMSMVELIPAAKSCIDDEKRAKRDADKLLQAEKKKMDEMLEKRRGLFAIAKQLFEQCVQADQLIKDAGVRSTTACPKDMDEKKSLAAEFERALSWWIGQVAIVISELHSAKRRAADAGERLKRAEQNGKDLDDQQSKCEKKIADMTQKLDDLKKKLKEEGERTDQNKTALDALRKKYDDELKNAQAAHENETARCQQLLAEYDEKANQARQGLKSFSADTASLRDQTSNLADRIDRALKEYRETKEKFERGTKEATEKIREKESAIQKSNTALIALETEAKDTERETEKCSKELDAAKSDMARRSDWRNGAKDRLDEANGLLEKDGETLQQLRGEEKSLAEKIQSNEKALENLSQRYRQITRIVEELDRKRRQLETENQDLRWRREEEFPRAAAQEPQAPCAICASNAKTGCEIPKLENELEQLEKEKAKLKEREEKVREERNRLQDDRVERKGTAVRPKSTTVPTPAPRTTPTPLPPRRARSLSTARSSKTSTTTTRRSRASSDSVYRKQMVRREPGGEMLAETGARRFDWTTEPDDDATDYDTYRYCDDGRTVINVTAQIQICSSSSTSSPPESSRTAADEGYDVDGNGNDVGQ